MNVRVLSREKREIERDREMIKRKKLVDESQGNDYLLERRKSKLHY